MLRPGLTTVILLILFGSTAQAGPVFLDSWGSEGTGDGEFRQPYDVALDSSGNVFVADHSNYRVQKFDSSGIYLDKWGEQGSEEGQFQYPQGVAIDSVGNAYVADIQGNRVQKFDGSGTYLDQ